MIYLEMLTTRLQIFLILIKQILANSFLNSFLHTIAEILFKKYLEFYPIMDLTNEDE